MADLSFLGKVTEYFASGQTAVDAILRRYGPPTTLASGRRSKGDIVDATPITLFEDPRRENTEIQGRGAAQAVTRTFYTRAEARGPDEITAQQGDEIVIVGTGDIFQIQTLNPWRKGPGDELVCTRVGRVGHAPYD